MPQVLGILRRETAQVTGAHMQITPEQGAFLTLLAELMGVRRAVEVGVFTGYSALAVALVGLNTLFETDADLLAADAVARRTTISKSSVTL